MDACASVKSRRRDREKSGARTRIRENALRLGVPRLTVMEGEAPVALEGLPTPQAVFVGGGVSDPAILEAGLVALPAGGRLVAHAVTIEGEQAILTAATRFGGAVSRLGMDRLDTVGRFHAWRPAMAVTQWSLIKGEGT